MEFFLRLCLFLAILLPVVVNLFLLSIIFGPQFFSQSNFFLDNPTKFDYYRMNNFGNVCGNVAGRIAVIMRHTTLKDIAEKLRLSILYLTWIKQKLNRNHSQN